MISKKIHYCWFGKHEMPTLNQACFNTWKEYLSDYEFVRWDETNYPKNEFTDYHLREKNWAFVSDYVRLYALYTEGGIYLDTDFEVLKSFDSLLDNSAFVAWESDEHINNAIAGSVKGNNFFNDCMEYMIKQFEKKEEYQTSPTITTYVLRSGEYDMKVYDKELFYPYNPYDRSRAINVLMYNMISDSTYAIHHWAKSWHIEAKDDRGTGLCVFLKKVLKKFSMLIPYRNSKN